jgi:hypothetical protein
MRFMNRCLCAASLLALVLAACRTSSGIQPASKAQATVATSAQKGMPTGSPRRHLLNFVIDGRTECSELRDHLGSPSASYESGGLITYRIAEDGQRRYSVFAVRDWSGARYSFVVTCDPGGIVTLHSLVHVKDAT